MVPRAHQCAHHSPFWPTQNFLLFPKHVTFAHGITPSAFHFSSLCFLFALFTFGYTPVSGFRSLHASEAAPPRQLNDFFFFLLSFALAASERGNFLSASGALRNEHKQYANRVYVGQEGASWRTRWPLPAAYCDRHTHINNRACSCAHMFAA